jgi:hypothetical protein
MGQRRPGPSGRAPSTGNQTSIKKDQTVERESWLVAVEKRGRGREGFRSKVRT